MPKHFRSLNQISIETPCDAVWDSMRGNDQVRFCEHCKLHVTDLSSLTRHEAMRLVRQSQGRLCVRYVQTPGGEILTRGSRRPNHLGRRVSRIAAGAFTAAVSISSAAAQASRTSVEANRAAAVVTHVPSPAKGAGISGVVTDPNGAVVPGATVNLVNKENGLAYVFVTRDDGSYQFSVLESGRYSLEVEAQSFAGTELSEFNFQAGVSQTVDLTLKIPEIIAEVEVISEPPVIQGGASFRQPTDPLTAAAFKNELQSLVNLLPLARDINAPDKTTGVTALSYAVENHNYEMVQILISAGASANAANGFNSDRETPLMFLNDGATVELVRALIVAGADVNAQDKSGQSVLLMTADTCKFEVFRELFAAGAKLDAKDHNGNTMLMRAAENPDTRIVQFLIGEGAAVDAKNDDGESALSFAARSGNHAALQALINGGATVHLASSDLDDALRAALGNEDSSTVKVLLEAGASPNTVDSKHKTALMLAAQSGKLETIRSLIDAGANLNAVDDDLWTALMYCDDVESVRILLNAGADMTVKSKDGQTVLAIAEAAGQEEIVKLLKSHGAPE